MKKIENLLVKNYTCFLPIENDERRYKIVTNDAGEELGIEVSGNVTDFSSVNFNGLKFEKTSYDKHITDYFEKNELNIPVDLMHRRDDVKHLAGVARKFVKSGNFIKMTAFIPKGVYFYNLIKLLIDNGILQGFSNLGCVEHGYYDQKEDCYVIQDFNLISVSLVDVPADVSGKLVGNATKFEGFGDNLPNKSIENGLEFLGL